MKTVISALKAVGTRNNHEDLPIATPSSGRTAVRVIGLVFLQLSLTALFYGLWLLLKSLAWQQDTIILTIAALASLLLVIGLAFRSPDDRP